MNFSWQHLPAHIDPIAFTVGFLSVRYYALCWLLGFFSAFGLLLLVKRRSSDTGATVEWYDLFLLLFLGAFLGGHLGYVLLYQPSLFWQAPLQLFWPYESGSGAWVGITGMSFHGGLVGALLFLAFFIKRKRWSFWATADRLVYVLPVALFFGRIGNFLNQELFGRLTDKPWGMYFPEAYPIHALRHPSALYEALGEGIVLFVLLSLLAKRQTYPGYISSCFLIGYGVIRFVLEFFREPDQGAPILFEIWTLGQAYSAVMVLIGGMLFLWLRKKNHDILRG